MTRPPRAADPRTWGLSRHYPPVRCDRCGRNPSDADDFAGWNDDFDAGVLVRYICPGCQTDADNAEAEINLATGASTGGWTLSPAAFGRLPVDRQAAIVAEMVERRTRRIMRERVERAGMAGDDVVEINIPEWVDEVVEGHPSFRDRPRTGRRRCANTRPRSSATPSTWTGRPSRDPRQGSARGPTGSHEGDLPRTVGGRVYLEAMTTTETLTREDVRQQRDQILDALGLTVEELAQRAEAGELVGDEWLAWAEVEELGYLLGE